ncbi:MAG: L,D-transpeptidase family protein [Candidatus Sphingomonas colombiensis]|nr:L,D-transpeptidase family protein [Sphingomonas sp.]WEK42157.1 MAG: L,D-transpeptidase family protein [Sphingomonas sp.]
MRLNLIGSSLAIASLALSGCNSQNNDPPPIDNKAAPSEAQWNDLTARQLREAIDRRATHGLDHFRFEDTGSTGGTGGPPDGERLTRVALAYAAALARGAVDPGKLYPAYTLPRPSPDLRRGLANALKVQKVDEWLESLAPQDDDYRKLGRAYLALRAQNAEPAAKIPATSKLLRPGAADPRMPAIARQLVALDYLDASAAQGRRYDPAMVDAVRRLQLDYALRQDGVIGDEVLGILNLSDADRARAIAVNMERMRWLERSPPATRIDVNIADARLTYWRDGKVADRRKVVVGKPDAETPQLGSPIFRLVANPTWTVPRSIERKEIAGKGAGYLRRNHMMRKDGRIVQQSGPHNSLGLVKFDMRNQESIYLHDTPAKQLFAAVQRQRSHGCVRVDDALGFADLLARDAGVLDQWHRARGTGKESFVSLPHEIPVRLLYQTVLFDADGAPIVRGDPYDWNGAIATALGFGAGKGWRLRANADDLGP